eukprot:5922608-Amphidinium_carterae.1
MAVAAGALDVGYLDEMLAGLPIVGLIATSSGWPRLQASSPAVSLKELNTRAWELRKRVQASVGKKGVTEHSRVLWEATQKD